MSAPPPLTKSNSGQLKLSEQEQKAIQFAILSANQNTIIGQFFSQSTTFLSFIFFLCFLLTLSASRAFTSKLDSAQRISGVLSRSYFKTDVRTYYSPHYLETLQLNFEPYQTRYETYRCANEPRSLGKQFHNYSIALSHRAQAIDNFALFSLPARSAPLDFHARVDFQGGELVLTDRFCIERDAFSGRRHEEELELLQNSARQQACCSLLELAQKTPKEFSSILQCSGDAACTFRAFLNFQRYVERADAYISMQIQMDELEITYDCWFVPANTQTNWRDTPWMLARPLSSRQDANSSSGLAELTMRHQSVFYIYTLQTFIFCIGAGIFTTVALVFINKKRYYEDRIRQKALQEIRTKQKVHSHLNKMKTLMKKT